MKKTGNLHLTPREIEIVKMFSQGENSRDIAKNLDISCLTVLSHMVSLRKKLEAKNMPHAISIAIVHGLINI